jgi:hypothetical protein
MIRTLMIYGKNLTHCGPSKVVSTTKNGSEKVNGVNGSRPTVNLNIKTNGLDDHHDSGTCYALLLGMQKVSKGFFAL